MYRGWGRGFTELGCDVTEFRLNNLLDFYSHVHMPDTQSETGFTKALSQEAAWQMCMLQLYAECYQWAPDIVFIVSGFMVPQSVICNLQKRGLQVVGLFTESPYEDVKQIERAAQYDALMVNDPTNLHRFKAANPRAYYQPHCYDPLVHSPGPAVPELKSEFAFVGSGYPSRVAFLEQVDWTGIDAVLAGHWPLLAESSPLVPLMGHGQDECLDNDRAVDVYRSSLMSANLYRQEADQPDLVDGWAMGPREVELAATGTMFITQPRGENREVLPMVPTFTAPEEFGDLVRYFRGHDRERDEVARQARGAIADRTFTNAASRLLMELDRHPVSA